VALALLVLSGCAPWVQGEIGCGELTGRVLVEWDREDAFIYRHKNNPRPLSFKASFMNVPIVPEDMFTDGASVPRVFWSIPGLSPWALGPAAIVHDWIFLVHRCGWPAPPEVKQITFEDSARILAQVGLALIEAGLVDHNLLEQIVWATTTRYARDLWDRPGTEKECRRPPEFRKGRRLAPGEPSFMIFDIPQSPRAFRRSRDCQFPRRLLASK
jgi:Protein of unknown function (DUF1353)